MMATVSQFLTPDNNHRENRDSRSFTSAKPRPDPNIPYYMNLVFPPWYLFTIVSVWYYGFFTVFPYVYDDPCAILGHRIFSTFILLEMMLNWLCICFVDSTFGRPPGMKGGRPRGGRIGATEGAVTHPAEPLPQNMVHRNGSVTQPLEENPAHVTKYYRTSDGSVIVSMPTSLSCPGEESPTRTTYPYFSWKPCLVCERVRPPRCHHCALCHKCVLKRDHHCYFAGACVGLYNQRHFIVFTFWASVATVYAFCHSLPYIYYEFLEQTSYVDLFLPLTLARFVLGYTDVRAFVLMTIEWSLMCFVFFSVVFFVEQMVLVSRSLTTFENENKMKLKDSRDLNGRIRAVFGENWPLHFLVPLHTIYEPEEDGINWNTITS